MRASTSLSFKNDSGASVMIDMINQTDSPCKITECMVGGITVNEYDLEDGTLSVIFPEESRLEALRQMFCQNMARRKTYIPMRISRCTLGKMLIRRNIITVV